MSHPHQAEGYVDVEYAVKCHHEAENHDKHHRYELEELARHRKNNLIQVDGEGGVGKGKRQRNYTRQT